MTLTQLICCNPTRCLGNTTIQCSVMSRLFRPGQALSRPWGGSMLCSVSRSWNRGWKPSTGRQIWWSGLYSRMKVYLLFIFRFLYVLRSLQRTLNELKEYQKQHDHYLRQQEALDKHKLLQEEQILRNIIHETQMAKEAQLGRMTCIKTKAK